MWYELYAILSDMENLYAKKIMYKAPPRELPGTEDAVAHGSAPHGGPSNPWKYFPLCPTVRMPYLNTYVMSIFR